MLTSRLLPSVLACLALSPFAAASDGPTLEDRLEKLAEVLEAAREAAHIPGMSIAIVKDDEVVWARGFGLADISTERPADESTIYAIGSTTKAFTATLLGTLVDEGKASWDDPVTRFLPYFDLQVRSDDENAQCTLRDLLCHRHGFTRMSLLWFAGNTSRSEILETAANAEPWDDFRANFHYCNVTYMAAGQAAGAAAEGTWDELMEARIFAPLGMTSSTLNRTEAQKDSRLALGYEWNKDSEEYEHLKMADLENVGPAGSVNSNVLDMAQWVRLQLGQGAVDDKRLITTERLLETWEPQIEIDDGVSYGLGWMLRDYDGRKVVEHGGNIEGFSAQIGLIPEEQLGYVLLMNLNAAPLQQSSLGMVFDALLAEWPEESPEDSSLASDEELDFADYTGTYIANFATFRDEGFKVRVTFDGLALNVPSQRVFDLKPPTKDGKWSFAMTDQIAVSFQRDDHGDVVGLTMHQGGFDFEVPRDGMQPEPEVPVEQLEKYVGTFVRAEGGKRIQWFIKDGQLYMEDKGKWLPFHAPDAEGHTSMRASTDLSATFRIDAEGLVESLIFHGSSGDKLFTRLATAPDSELPLLDELLVLRKTDARIAAIEAAGGTRITGKVWFAQAGLRGELTIYTEGTDRYATRMDLGKFGRVEAVANKGDAWSYNSMQGFDVLTGDELTQAILGNPGAIEGDWNEYFDSVEVVRSDMVGDRSVIVVRLLKTDMPSRTYWVDAENGDVLRVNQIFIEGPVRLPVTVTLSDFREIEGIRTAMRIESENEAAGRTVMTLETIESGLDLAADVFVLEDPGAK